MEKLFFDSADAIWRVAISAPIMYVVVIGFIRVSGKRTTSQMNNFDWIVTVAMGSLVGSGIIAKDVALVEVILAMGLLLALQYGVTRAVVSSETVSALVKASPRLLLYDGEIVREAMIEERISVKELMAALRDNGIRDVDDVEAVVLETDASLSVLRKDPDNLEPAESFSEVIGWPKHRG